MPRPDKSSRPSSVPGSLIWIVIADAAQARIFQALREDGKLTEIATLRNPEGRLTPQEMVSDRAGRMGRGRGSTGHAFEPHDSVEEHVAERFARHVCAHLAAAQHDGYVKRLYLVADPKFLGQLRRHMDPRTRDIVAQEQTSDLARRRPDTIRRALPEHL